MGSFQITAPPVADRLAATGARLGDTATLTGPAADAILRLAGPRTPTRTGRLAASAAVTADGVRWGVGYAVFVNYGTRRMRAQQFATDALEAAETETDILAAVWAADILEGT
jgi:hypothetical protein